MAANTGAKCFCPPNAHCSSEFFSRKLVLIIINKYNINDKNLSLPYIVQLWLDRRCPLSRLALLWKKQFKFMIISTHAAKNLRDCLFPDHQICMEFIRITQYKKLNLLVSFISSFWITDNNYGRYFLFISLLSLEKTFLFYYRCGENCSCLSFNCFRI